MWALGRAVWRAVNMLYNASLSRRSPPRCLSEAGRWALYHTLGADVVSRYVRNAHELVDRSSSRSLESDYDVSKRDCFMATRYSSIIYHLPRGSSSNPSSADHLHIFVSVETNRPSSFDLQFAPIAFLSFNVTASSSRSFLLSVRISIAYALITCFTWPVWKLIFALRITFVLGPTLHSLASDILDVSSMHWVFAGQQNSPAQATNTNFVRSLYSSFPNLTLTYPYAASSSPTPPSTPQWYPALSAPTSDCLS